MAAVAASRGFTSDPLWQQAQAHLQRGSVEDARKMLASLQARASADDVHAHLLAAQIAWREDRVRGAAGTRAQVRSPLHDRAHGEWRRYESKLEPLRLSGVS